MSEAHGYMVVDIPLQRDESSTSVPASDIPSGSAIQWGSMGQSVGGGGVGNKSILGQIQLGAHTKFTPKGGGAVAPLNLT